MPEGEEKRGRGRPPGGRMVTYKLEGGIEVRQYAYPKQVEGKTRWVTATGADLTHLIPGEEGKEMASDPGTTGAAVPPGPPPAPAPAMTKAQPQASDPAPATALLTEAQRRELVDEVLEAVEGERLSIYRDLTQELHDLKEIYGGLLIQCKNTIRAIEKREGELQDIARRAEMALAQKKNLTKGSIFRPEGSGGRV